MGSSGETTVRIPPGLRPGAVALSAVLLLSPGLPAADPELMFSVDAPSDLDGTFFLADQTVLKAAGASTYGLAFSDDASLGDGVNVDAVYLIADGGCSPDPCYEFLFSVDTSVVLSGTTYYPWDVIRHDLAGTYSLEWRPTGVEANLVGVGQDASHNLVVSFDSPVDLGSGTTLLPADVGRVVSGSLQTTKFFEGSTDVSPALGSDVNITGLETDDAGNLYLTFDASLPDHGIEVGEIGAWDAVSQGLSVFWSDAGFPAGGVLSGFSFGVPPARISDDSLRLSKSGGDLELSWDHGCAAVPDADKEYVIYEGTLASLYDHQSLDCAPTLGSCGSDACATVTPGAGSRYYLVVPKNADFEGSYGQDSTGAERPASDNPCGGLPQKAGECAVAPLTSAATIHR